VVWVCGCGVRAMRALDGRRLGLPALGLPGHRATAYRFVYTWLIAVHTSILPQLCSRLPPLFFLFSPPHLSPPIFARYNGQTIATVEGDTLAVAIDPSTGVIFINDAIILLADVQASNGVVHIINKVLTPPANLAEVAAADAELSTLSTLVQLAGLTDALATTVGLTVFAPNNAAFNSLGAVALQYLQAPENLATLKAVLTYHLAYGVATIANIYDGQSIRTLLGSNVDVSIFPGPTVGINQALVVTEDVTASNGVVQVIDRVLLPPGTTTGKNIVQIAQADPELSLLVSLLTSSGLLRALSIGGPNTLFAPTNAAFEALGPAKLQQLADPLYINELLNILTYHVVAGTLDSADLANTLVVFTVEGQAAQVRTVTSSGETDIFINNAEVVKADQVATNGILHVINQVLLPPMSSEEAVDEAVAEK
jgi:transforming growth factor-beta-induced protein